MTTTEGAPETHTPLRVALLGGTTTELLERPLKLALASRGLAPALYAAPYNQIHQELWDTDSGTTRFAPQLGVVIPSHHNLLAWPEAGASPENAAEVAAHAAHRFLGPFDAFHQKNGTEFIVANWLPPLRRPDGDFGAATPSNATNFIRRVNLALADLAPRYVHVLDLAGLAERHGLENFVDERLWYDAKMSVAPHFLPDLAKAIAAVAAASLGKSKKVLVLDLDNTLWGGVIGDDGLEGIDLGEGSGVGEAHKAIQEYALALKKRGIMLAVASKNEEATAKEPFVRHPETVLRLKDFASFKANWEPKSDNLRAIAQELDLGLDSFVFLDDNPAERAEVESALPDVRVIQGSSDPVDMLKALDESRLFEVVTVTSDDRRRADQYRARAEASTLMASARNMTEFLASLNMTATVVPLLGPDLGRVTQLVNKTNQFNLTTWRMTRAHVDAVARASDWIHLTARLGDRFGDHGLIAAVMGRIEEDVAYIENWLMSCRVLKRGVERLMLNQLVQLAASRNVRALEGQYLPTARNALVAGHYEALGFERVSSHPDGSTVWWLDVDDYKPLEHFITAGNDGWKATNWSGSEFERSSVISSRTMSSKLVP